MMNLRIPAIAAMSTIAALAGCASATPANANGWRFVPARCPDLVEDRRDRAESRRDERYTRGPRDRAEDRADRRESRRDERITVCPASAWVWEGPRRHRTARPNAATIYYDVHGRHYYRYGPERVRITVTF